MPRILDREATATASDYRRTRPPRALVHVDDRIRAVARQRAEGVTRVELARFYGVTPDTISDWCTKVRTADQEARNMGAGR